MTPDEMMKKAEQDYLDAFVEHAKCMFAVDDWTKHNPEKHVIDNGPVWTAYEAARIAMDRYGVAYLRARLGDGPADRMWKIMKEDER